jgi:hypothetical protein
MKLPRRNFLHLAAGRQHEGGADSTFGAPGGRAPPGHKNLVRLSKFAVLALQGLQLLGHIGRNAARLPLSTSAFFTNPEESAPCSRS